MTVAFILLTCLLVAALLLWSHDRLTRKDSEPEVVEPKEECCGMHITCERDSLLASVSAQIEYYDDEELDIYRDCDPAAYSEEQIEQFRDILLSMRPDDIAGWARSLQLRHVPLPEPVRDELIMIVSEERIKRTAPNVTLS